MKVKKVIVIVITSIFVISLVLMMLYGSHGETAMKSALSDRFIKVVRGDLPLVIEKSSVIQNTENFHLRCPLDDSILEYFIPEGKKVTKDTLVLNFKNEELSNRIKNAQESILNFDDQIKGYESSMDELKIKINEHLRQLEIKKHEKVMAYIEFKQVREKENLSPFVKKIREATEALKKEKEKLARKKEKFRKKDYSDQEKRLAAEEEIQKITYQINFSLADDLKKAFKEKSAYIKNQLPRQERRLIQKIDDVHLEIKNYKINSKKQVSSIEKKIDDYKKKRKKLYEELQENIKKEKSLSIYSSVEGMIVYGNPNDINDSIAITLGKTYSKDQILLTIPVHSDMFALLKVEENKRSLFTVSTDAVLQVKAIPDLVLHGNVQKISNIALPKYQGDEDAPKVFFVRTLYRQQKGMDRISPGMSVRVRLLGKTIKNVMLLPLEAVFYNEEGAFVRLKDLSSKPRIIKVLVGESNAHQVVIREGLKEGDEIFLFNPMEKNGKDGNAGH
jgi:multidrug efflux pump subunit AcrA (membrane-fusion protein)